MFKKQYQQASTAANLKLTAKEVKKYSSTNILTVPCYGFSYASFKWYTFNNIEVISTLSRINMYDSLKNLPSLLN